MKRIRLNENQFNRIVSKCVRKALKENFEKESKTQETLQLIADKMETNWCYDEIRAYLYQDQIDENTILRYLNPKQAKSVTDVYDAIKLLTPLQALTIVYDVCGSMGEMLEMYNDELRFK